MHTGRMRGHRLAPAVSRAGMGRASSELPQDGAGSPGCRGRAPSSRREGRSGVPAVGAEPGASGGRWVATAARRRGERAGRGRGDRKRGSEGRMLALGMVPSASPCPSKRQTPEGLNTLKAAPGIWKGAVSYMSETNSSVRPRNKTLSHRGHR